MTTPSATTNAAPPKEATTDNGTMPPRVPNLQIDSSRVATLAANLGAVRSRITAAASAGAGAGSKKTAPRLVAVSKLKPATDILALATLGDGHKEAPQRHFGENYVQELIEKSRILWDAETADESRDEQKAGRSIRWHFIGGLQSNKASMLARDCRGLWCVESVDGVKKARGLSKGWAEREWSHEEAERGDDDEKRLRVMIQVNTSGEEGKSGVEPNSDELKELAKCVVDECSAKLKLVGLMTIGAIARSKAAAEGQENEDFIRLKEVRAWLAKEMGWDDEQLELSMGMSDDFESAVRLGSGEVRIGSTIFGERPPKSEAKVV